MSGVAGLEVEEGGPELTHSSGLTGRGAEQETSARASPHLRSDPICSNELHRTELWM